MSNIEKPSIQPAEQSAGTNEATSTKAELLSAIGYILGISYPVLALSTGARALYQLFFKADVIYYLPPALSGVAAICYLVATIGFLYRHRWAWYLSVGTLGFETLMTLLIGTLSFITPDLIGRTAWRHFGADYGYFPLFQPLFGLVWLFLPETLRSYNIATWKDHHT